VIGWRALFLKFEFVALKLSLDKDEKVKTKISNRWGVE